MFVPSRLKGQSPRAAGSFCDSDTARVASLMGQTIQWQPSERTQTWWTGGDRNLYTCVGMRRPLLFLTVLHTSWGHHGPSMVHCCFESIGSRSWQTHGRSEVRIGVMYAASARKLKHTSSVYGLLSTFLPDSPSYEHIKTDVLVGGGRKENVWTLCSEKERLEWRRSGRRERKLTHALRRNNPCTNSRARVSKSIG